MSDRADSLDSEYENDGWKPIFICNEQYNSGATCSLSYFVFQLI